MKVAIVGAGPRGLSVLERIVAHARVQEEEAIQIKIFDPFGPGGKIWRVNQSLNVKMNTVCCQVTLFTDETLSTGGPIAKGPNLYEWATSLAADFIQANSALPQEPFLLECMTLEPNDHCSRALYGVYQQWFYAYIQTRLTPQTSITFFRDTVKSIRKGDTSFRLYTKAVETTVDKVVLAVGHLDMQHSQTAQTFADFAAEHRLLYVAPKNAADAYLQAIRPKEAVIVRGLGLTFFDYVARLTRERGGLFRRVNQQLVYISSGQEPKIIAGSRRGFPYHPRGKNQKTYGVECQPKFLTPQKLAQWKNEQTVSATDFFAWLKRELAFVYYTRLVKKKYPNIDAQAFQADLLREAAPQDWVQNYPIASEDLLDWAQIAQPLLQKSEQESYEAFMLRYIETCWRAAKEGNLTNPLSSAFDALKDLRDEVRWMLREQLFTDDDAWHVLWQWFTPLNAFLSVGPPLERMEELQALIQAGVVVLLAPNMQVDMTDGQFLAYSQLETEKSYAASYLIDAYLPKIAIEQSRNPLIQQLLEAQLIHPHTLTLANQDTQKTGAIAVDVKTNQVLQANGQALANFYCFGVPTEGVHWLTTTTARPGTDAWNLREADQLAEAIVTKNPQTI